MKHPLKLSLVKCATFGLGLVGPGSLAMAQSTYTINDSTADAFLSAANPTSNYGAAGTLAIAPASSAKGEFDSVVLFSTASAVNQFNSTYGAGNWTLSGVQLSLASNFGIQGEKPTNGLFNNVSAGSFGIDWLANNTWAEGGGTGTGTPGYPNNSAVTFDSIASLQLSGLDTLGTYAYTPPGNNNNIYLNYTLPLDANLVANAAGGGNVSLYFFAADNQVSYLFDSLNYSTGHPELTLTASAVPEANPAGFLAAFLGGFLLLRGRTST